MTERGPVHVVDDDSGMRDSLRMLLESSGFSVCTHDGAETLLASGGVLSGCVLTDLRMPGVDGLELQRRLLERGIQIPVIVMTGAGDVGIAVRAMKTGAIDFLEKPFADEALFDAVGRALRESERLNAVAATAKEAEERLAALTPREREVLDLLVEGLPNKAIANTLGTSPRTIEVHRARVLEKLRAHSLPDLMRVVLAARTV